ncbi:MAG: TonB-dependent receptor [Bacteroidales bacterium]|nr:TonB-dependent receptor [Bacteroidales bacterium]
MKTIFSFLTLFIMCLGVAYAGPEDKAAISGKIIDGKTSQPVEYATVAIYNQNDNSLITGTITSLGGVFRIENVKSGVYYLKASFIGYNEKIMRDISIHGKDIDLGVIKLETSDAEIEEVEITAQKKDISYQIDKKVINISTDINADNGSAADALEGVPSVDVDIDGNVSLRGSSNFTVLIDGKPTALDAAEVLKQTPAAMIDNIEIITNPSAKYDPEGTTGIINLVTKKNMVQGVNGVINANVGSQGRYGGDFLLNSRKGKVNYFVGGHFNQRGINFESESNRITKNVDNEYDKYVNQTSSAKRRFGGGGLKTGLDYYANDNNLFNFSIEGGLFGSSNDGNTDYDNWSLYHNNSEKTNIETVSSISDDSDDAKYFNSSLAWTHNFAGKGHKLNVNGFFSHSDRDADNSFEQTVKETNYFTGHNVSDDKITDRGRINIDYTKPYDNGNKFEAGFQEDLNHGVTDYDYDDYDQSSKSYVNNQTFTNDVDFKRYISSIYSTFSAQFGTFGLQLGLRGEYTYRQMDTKNPITDSTFKINRFDLFPSLHLSKTVGEKNSVQAGYSRRIRRPWERALNPFPAYSDEYTRMVGNPDLKPQYTDVVELNYQMNFDKMFWALETFYRHTIGATENVSTLATDGSGILISRFENLSTNNNFGLELSGNYDINKWIRFNTTFEVRKYYISGNYNGQDLSREGSSWRTKETLSLSPGKTTKIQLNFRYNGRNKTLISDNKGDFDLGLAIRQSFFKKKLSVSFSMRDMTGAHKRKQTTDTPEYYLYTERYRQAPVWNLGISFKINSVKDKRPEGEEGEGGSDNDSMDNSFEGGSDF